MTLDSKEPFIHEQLEKLTNRSRMLFAVSCAEQGLRLYKKWQFETRYEMANSNFFQQVVASSWILIDQIDNINVEADSLFVACRQYIPRLKDYDEQDDVGRAIDSAACVMCSLRCCLLEGDIYWATGTAMCVLHAVDDTYIHRQAYVDNSNYEEFQTVYGREWDRQQQLIRFLYQRDRESNLVTKPDIAIYLNSILNPRENSSDLQELLL